jgi:hypothetical protein
VRDRLTRRRHHAVVSGDDKDGDVGGLSAAGTHGRERLVARCVEEGQPAALRLDLVGTNVLGDAAGFAFRHVGGANRVEQLGLAVVDVPHDGDDRRAGCRLGILIALLPAPLEVRDGARERGFLLVGFPA